MHFNNYVWDLYADSDRGKKIIASYDPEEIKKQMMEVDENQQVYDYLIDKHIDSPDAAEILFSEIIDNGIPLLEKGDNGLMVEYFRIGGGYDSIYTDIGYISSMLYATYPQYFIPFEYDEKYYIFSKICDVFRLETPEIPSKNQKKLRARYYYELNSSLFSFMKQYNLSVQEMCAFLYDFAPNFIENYDFDFIPEPTKIWLVGGGKSGNGDFSYLDECDDESKHFWQGNIDTRPGDIIIMYCLSPRSYIHSIWRAVAPGHANPFFYYYNQIFVGFPRKVTPVSFNELKNDDIWKKKGIVKAHMQGLHGKAVSIEEYSALLDILESKDQDISYLPTLKRIEGNWVTKPLNNEKDVENELIIPLLERLGYTENDWVRQLPIRMGTGFRYYPDFAIGVKGKKNDENARLILEAKYEIANNRQLIEAFIQAKSYALRLQANTIVLASNDSIWCYNKNSGKFSPEPVIHLKWSQLNHPDRFHTILQVVGKDKVLK